ncbi:hypothetical protein B0H11DRAFT_1908430 [Mycena galericulata]|nr:hypothetical protein B0H11DRAFT_1908430 [Mycena galericulata]
MLSRCIGVFFCPAPPYRSYHLRLLLTAFGAIFLTRLDPSRECRPSAVNPSGKLPPISSTLHTSLAWYRGRGDVTGNWSSINWIVLARVESYTRELNAGYTDHHVPIRPRNYQSPGASSKLHKDFYASCWISINKNVARYETGVDGIQSCTGILDRCEWVIPGSQKKTGKNLSQPEYPKKQNILTPDQQVLTRSRTAAPQAGTSPRTKGPRSNVHVVKGIRTAMKSVALSTARSKKKMVHTLPMSSRLASRGVKPPAFAEATSQKQMGASSALHKDCSGGNPRMSDEETWKGEETKEHLRGQWISRVGSNHALSRYHGFSGGVEPLTLPKDLEIK